MAYCPRCGVANSPGAAYCSHCSAPATIPQRRKRPVAGIAAIVAAGLAVILLFQFVIGPLISGGTISGGKAGSNKVISAGSVEVSPANPTAVIDGVTVAANPLNLGDGNQTVTVETRAQALGEDGFLGQEYDISLGDTHYLRAPVTVTLPYDKGAAQDSVVCVLHLDSDYGEWIPLATELDADAGTVAVKLGTLSPVRLVYFDKEYANSLYYITGKNSVDAKFAVSYNYWDIIKNTSLEPARIVAQDYILNGNTKSSTEQMIATADGAISALSTYYDMFGSLGEAALGAAGHSSDALKAVTNNTAKGLGKVSLIIAGGQLAFDLGTKGPNDPRRQTATNLYKNIATNAGTFYSMTTGYSAASFSLCFFGVAVIGFGLDYAVDTAKKIQAETVKAVFDTYYREHTSFNEQDWYKIFVDAYWDAWQNDRTSKEGMDYAIKRVTDAIDAHAETFWKEIYRNGSDALTFAVAEAGKKTTYTPTPEQKVELTARFKQDMFKRFNEKALPWINEFMLAQMQGAVHSALWQAVKPYNTYYTVRIQETAPEDGEADCTYQQCPIRFGTQEGFVATDFPDQWALLAPKGDEEWSTELKVTLLGYMMAGAPDKVFLFEPFDEEKRFGGEIATRGLQLAGEEKGYTTVVDLSGQATAEYVWALTRIESTAAMEGSLDSGPRGVKGIYAMDVDLTVGETELAIQCTKDTLDGPQTAQARLTYPAMIMPDVEGGLTASASMLSNTFVDRKGEFRAFAYVEYRDPMGHKTAVGREPGSEDVLSMSPLPQPGKSIPTGYMKRMGLQEHVIEAGLGISDGMGIPPRYGVILTYTWMTYEEAVKTKPRIGS